MMDRNEQMKEAILNKVFADMEAKTIQEGTCFEINDIFTHYTSPTQIEVFGGMNVTYLLRDLEQTVSPSYFEELFQIIVKH
jgi:hypothetical protein